MTFASKQEAMEFAINSLIEGELITDSQLSAVKAAGVNMEQVEAYVRQALLTPEPEGED